MRCFMNASGNAGACRTWCSYLHSDIAHPCCQSQRLSQAVAECVDAQVPESVIRQVGENEYQAKLHELQLKVSHLSP